MEEVEVNKVDERKKELLEALETEEGQGNVTNACRLIGMSRANYYKWLNNDPEFAAKAAKAIQLGRELIMDTVEDALLKLIKEGNTAAIIFAAKTLCRSRGYSEHQVIETKADTAVDIVVEACEEK